MSKTKVFVSYDYEHDLDMKNNLITESNRPDSPFSINDLSLNEKVPGLKQRNVNCIGGTKDRAIV